MCWKRKTFLVFESSRIQKGLGQLGAVFPESKIITLIVLRFRILSFSTANTTARCHTSKKRILTPCNFFSRIFYCNRHTLLIIHVVYDVILTGWEIWPSKESACTELLKASLGRTKAQSQWTFYEQPHRFVTSSITSAETLFLNYWWIARITENLIFHLRRSSSTNSICILTLT